MASDISLPQGEETKAQQAESKDPKRDHTTNDPRAGRTRQQIFDALRQLMSDGNASVTVHQVVQAAGISRSSFYAHFASLDELAAELLRNQFAAIGTSGVDLRREDLIVGRAAARIGYTRLVEHMVENFPLYSSALEMPLARNAYDEIVEAYATRLVDSMVQVESVPSGINVSLATTYIAGGAMTLISAWMRERLEVSDDELVDQLVALLPYWILEPTTTEKTNA